MLGFEPSIERLKAQTLLRSRGLDGPPAGFEGVCPLHEPYRPNSRVQIINVSFVCRLCGHKQRVVDRRSDRLDVIGGEQRH
eukprot:5369850-Prymnesium_polylepis.1